MADQLLQTGTRLFFGADPEFFLSQEGRIVGSERALPEAGITAEPFMAKPEHGLSAEGPSIIRDGIQVELNIPPTDCREWFCLEICLGFRKLKDHLAAMQASGQSFDVSFKQVVEVDAKELKSVSPMSRRLGCAPSFNIYSPLLTVEHRLKAVGHTANTYPIRSAGGHIHLGLPPHLMSERERLPLLMDILLGNTAVLLDRDPDMALRRKIYGCAGEFRLPRHGLEYRTLSNFWLRSKELTSLVLGLSRLAVYVLDTSCDEHGWAADQALIDLISIKHIEEAINENNLDLARANFEGVKTFLTRHLPAAHPPRECGLAGSNLPQFDRFLADVSQRGLDGIFPGNPAEDWCSVNWLAGWERFLDDTYYSI